jgi:dipeptidyl aminopeptidase/acylaminoacyl peptidase
VSYLTLPADEPAVPLPLVLVSTADHRDATSTGIAPITKWLANRGYAVLSVSYRASTGLGKDFANASIRERAGKMDDDLIDASRMGGAGRRCAAR